MIKVTRWIQATAVCGIMLPAHAWAQAAQAPVGVPPTEHEKRALEVKIAAQTPPRLIASVETRVTPGRPYSAEAVTESLQVLADGNRISRKSATRIFRDGQGRTRREQLGDDDIADSITINDTVGSASYTLNPSTKTAFRSSLLALKTPMAVAPSGMGTGGGRGGDRVMAWAPTSAPPVVVGEEHRRQVERTRTAAVEMAETSHQAAAQAKLVVEKAASGGGTTTRENLGEQTIEGVRAVGTRATTVIAAGSSLGNAQEIKIVSEQWFSPDLEVFVLTRHHDPRVGETVYRLTQISRGEPDPNLFIVPGDYTLRSRGIKE